MKANINIQINVPTDFESGQCEKCPLACKSYFENHYVEETVSCKLGYTSITCPIDVEKEHN